MKLYQKILLGIACTLFAASIGGYYWLTNGWKEYISEEELIIYSGKMKNTPPPSEEFRELYYKLNPEEKEATLTSELLERFVNVIISNRHRTKGNCSCDDIFHYDWAYTTILKRDGKEKHNPFKYIQLGFGLEKFLTNDECLNYSMRIQYNRNFIRSYQGYSFEGKNFDDLEREEIIDFFIAEKSPTFFSPLRNPERYLARKKMIEEMINRSE